MKRIVTVQDISCVGKCSLTVALPVISAMGIETAVIPTAVLSTHTAFKDFTFRDLTDDIMPIAEHWKKEGFDFSAIYTGYLGSERQLSLVNSLFDMFKTDDTIIFVDPVMADNGSLYKGFTSEFAEKMAKLCSKADIIVPNLTEASFMLGIDYAGNDYDEAYIKDILKKLTELGAKTAVITGVCLEENKLGAMAYDSVNNEYYSAYSPKVPASYHGTGDIFASTLLGALVRGNGLEKALRIAVGYTYKCIDITYNAPDSNWYGVDFESAIPYLTDIIK